MMTEKGRLALIIGVIIALTATGVVFGLAWPLTQVQAGATLPPRDNATPAPSDSDDDDGELPGAYIELQTQPAQSSLWSAVQWQDSDGNWHNVDGWRGSLDANGARRWWVAPRDFGKGPFRWVVAVGPGQPPLGVSDLFNLPDGAMKELRINVTVN